MDVPNLINGTEAVQNLDDLLLAEGLLVFETAEEGAIRGELSFPPGDARLTLKGSLQTGVPTTAKFQRRRDDATSAKGWVYDYIGYLVPNWPDGRGQVMALVGSVVRTVPHAGGQGSMRPAGIVYSFVAVERGFVEPRTVIPLPDYVIEMLASRHDRLHHLVWHGTRNMWLSPSLGKEKKLAIRKLGWEPPRPAKRGDPPIVDNGSGEDFLFMHRQMVGEVRSLMQQHQKSRIEAWG